MPQLEADVAFMKRLLAANQIDNQTFNNQRDHMLIQGSTLPATNRSIDSIDCVSCVKRAADRRLARSLCRIPT